MLSIVIPTYNEREVIEDTIREISKVFERSGLEGEIVVVDDDSPDKTWEFVESLKNKYPVSVIRRMNKRGLSSAVIDGWKAAKGDILGVMDADGSHDPSIIPDMVRSIKKGCCDIAIGSRYIVGGGMKDWPWHRVFISKTAIMFSRPVTTIKDATSGYCLFKRDIIDNAELDPIGWKIVLEVAVKGNYKKHKEFPYIFRDRLKGRSKLGKNAILNYFEHLWKLHGWMKLHGKSRV